MSVVHQPASIVPQRSFSEALSDILVRCCLLPVGVLRVTEAKQQNLTPGLEVLSKVASVASDSTGLETFARYRWQAKQVVRQWLTCLREQDRPLFLACEHVEDLTLVYADKVRFIQLKTRDKGSWSVTAMNDRGLDALTRSYVAARKRQIHTLCTFELWVEGATAGKADTEDFVQDPRSASDEVRKKLAVHRIPRGWIDDFLQRLVIEPDQPTQAHIDARAMWELHALWPALSHPEVRYLYERLLTAAEAAQTSGQGQPPSIQAILAAALPHIAYDLPEPHEPAGQAIDPIRDQILSRGMLLAITPPQPGESQQQLLARISAGSTASLMELKMTAAGASRPLIAKMQEMRADMEIERQLMLASRDSAEDDLERLAQKVLRMAEATAADVALAAVTNPAAAGRPAEAIANSLLSQPANLAHCDRQNIFDRDDVLLFGYLGHLSDTCRFGWRAS